MKEVVSEYNVPDNAVAIVHDQGSNFKGQVVFKRSSAKAELVLLTVCSYVLLRGLVSVL